MPVPSALADDLRRYLEGRPILARRSTAIERLLAMVPPQPGTRGHQRDDRPVDGCRSRRDPLAMVRGRAGSPRGDPEGDG